MLCAAPTIKLCSHICIPRLLSIHVNVSAPQPTNRKIARVMRGAALIYQRSTAELALCML